MRRIAGLAVVLVMATMMRATPAEAAGVPVPEDDPFYDVPTDIGAYENGEVIDSRPIDPKVFQLPIPAHGWQLKYRTEDHKRRASATVTTVLVPDAPWKGAGPRPLLSYQTAEDGVAGKCAPSYAFTAGVPKALSNSYAELGLVALAVQRGWAVSVPDYEGPQSEFLVAAVQAKGILDGIRAARNFADAGISRQAPIGLWGYSGGGLATLTAAQWHPSYAPELPIAAVAAGAPATDVRASIDALSGSYAGGAVAMGVNGFLRAYPELHLTQYLSEAGRSKVNAAAGDCINDAAIRFPLLRIEQLEATPHALQQPPVEGMLRANSPLYIDRVPRAPIYHYHSMLDELAPIRPARATMRKFCEHGVVVQHVEPLGGHLTVVATGAPAAMRFLADRFAGKPPVNTCATIPR
jgi:hypothetical protein